MKKDISLLLTIPVLQSRSGIVLVWTDSLQVASRKTVN